MELTLYQFNLLEKEQQAEAVWDGVYLDSRMEEKFKVLLYQVNGFYVEVYYDYFNNEIEKFRSFSTTNQLNNYLMRIDLSKLL